MMLSDGGSNGGRGTAGDDLTINALGFTFSMSPFPWARCPQVRHECQTFANLRCFCFDCVETLDQARHRCFSLQPAAMNRQPPLL